MELVNAIEEASKKGFHIVGWQKEAGFVVYHPTDPPKDVVAHFLCIKTGKRPLKLSNVAHQMLDSMYR